MTIDEAIHMDDIFPCRCPKCGLTTIMVKYWKETVIFVKAKPGRVEPEYLELTCACGYVWTRPCLDAKP